MIHTVATLEPMARVAATLGEAGTGTTPILACPRLGVERAIARLPSGNG